MKNSTSTISAPYPFGDTHHEKHHHLNDFCRSFWCAIKKFSHENWWIYFIYAVLMAVIVYKENGPHTVNVAIITSSHFIADILIMMMFEAYQKKEFMRGTYYQILSMLIFLSIKIFTVIEDNLWHFLTADAIFICAAIKNYQKDAHNRIIKIINFRSMLIAIVLIFGCIWLPLKFSGELPGFLETGSSWLQTAGICLFAITLCDTEHKDRQAVLVIVALVYMVIGSAWDVLAAIADDSTSVTGLSLSYFLLPLTVLAFYLKNWKKERQPA